MLAEFDAESMKRAGVQAVQETFDHELSAQIEPFDLVDDGRFEIFFYGHFFEFGVWRSEVGIRRSEFKKVL